MSNSKVFLKFNRIGDTEDICLSFWLELFKEYKIYIVCDLFNVKTDKIPDNLKNITKNYNVNFINSNYSLGNLFVPYLKSRKRNMASANLTCFEYLDTLDEFCWIIDADDTHFISPNWKLLREQFVNAEQYLKEKNLDAFSLDFYRNYNDTWTFGVCLLKSSIKWEQIKSITDKDLKRFGLPGNCDSVFDVLGRLGHLQLKNFVFNDTKFQHVYNNFKGLTDGIYYWNNGKLWNTPLKEDIIIL